MSSPEPFLTVNVTGFQQTERYLSFSLWVIDSKVFLTLIFMYWNVIKTLLIEYCITLSSLFYDKKRSLIFLVIKFSQHCIHFLFKQQNLESVDIYDIFTKEGFCNIKAFLDITEECMNILLGNFIFMYY